MSQLRILVIEPDDGDAQRLLEWLRLRNAADGLTRWTGVPAAIDLDDYEVVFTCESCVSTRDVSERVARSCGEWIVLTRSKDPYAAQTWLDVGARACLDKATWTAQSVDAVLQRVAWSSDYGALPLQVDSDDALSQHQLQDAQRQWASSVAHEIGNPAATALANLASFSEQLVDARSGQQAWLEEFAALHGSTLASDVAGAMLRFGVVHETTAGVVPEPLRDALEALERIRTRLGELHTAAGNYELTARTDLNAIATEVVERMGQRLRVTVQMELEPRGAIARAQPDEIASVVEELLLRVDKAFADPRADDQVLLRTRQDDGLARIAIEATAMHGFLPLDPPRLNSRRVGNGLGFLVSKERVATANGDADLVRYEAVVQGTRPRDKGGSHVTSVATARPRILVVDDEEPLLRAYPRLLGRNVDVVIARNGQEALEEIQANAAFDVVLCDLSMPGMDGQALYEQLQSQWPALVQRMAFVTGGALTVRTHAFLASTQAPILHKPFATKDLRRLVHALLTGTHEDPAVPMPS